MSESNSTTSVTVKCPICYDDLLGLAYKPATAIQCGHLFCASCLNSHRQISPLCPTCRAEIVRTIKVKLRQESDGNIPMLTAEAVSCSNSLMSILHSVAPSIPLTYENCTVVSKSAQAFVNALDCSVAGPSLESLVSTLKGHVAVIRAAEGQLHEDKILDGQLARWSSLNATEYQISVAAEEQLKVRSCRRADLDQELQSVLRDVGRVGTLIDEEIKNHQKTMEDLRRRLCALQDHD